MSDKHEELLQQMAELTSAVKSGHEDKATFDWDAAKDEFSGQIEEMVDKQVQEKLDAQPVRKGDPIVAEAVDKMGGSQAFEGNRYRHMVKDMAKDGFYKDYLRQRFLPVDFLLTKQVMFAAGLTPSDDLELALKALTSTGTGTGAELVPTDLAAQLWEDVHLANVLVGNLEPIAMTSNPMDLPNALGDVTFRKGSQNVAFTASDPATSDQTLTVTEVGAEVDWSYTLDEDAIVALMPAVRRTLARNAAEYMDGFALNADNETGATGNVNNDDGVPDGDSYYLSGGQNGIRRQWLVDNTNQGLDAGGDALTDADITSCLVKMGKYAADPRGLLCVIDVDTYLRGFLNATSTSAPGTFIKSEADVGYSIIATGQVASYRGIPLVIPTMAPKTESDGKQSITAASNTFGQANFVNRSQWKSGFLREMLIEVDRDIQKRQIIMVVSYRQAIGCRGTRSSATHTAGIYEILVT